ncbi:uncharacterized protein [Drosophila suzukii]|uniref:Uncharacterized protein n=1 Tax=Drosophila suzukii TaxID=28584 RepID=A0ABM4TX08_DROSZ
MFETGPRGPPLAAVGPQQRQCPQSPLAEGGRIEAKLPFQLYVQTALRSPGQIQHSGECVPHWARIKTRRTTRDTRNALVSGHLILRSSCGKGGDEDNYGSRG